MKDHTRKEDVLNRIKSPPARSSFDEEGNEVLEWDARVRRSRPTTSFEEKIERESGVIPSSYTSYYAYCTVKITFNPEGRKIAHEYIGAGCFNKEGKIYQTNSWWPDE